MEEPKSLSNIVAFQDIPNEITNNQKITCFYSVASGYLPHRLDKIHLCPLDYTLDLQELNTWDFVNCQLTENQLYPYTGIVVFPCEKYGFLVMDHVDTSGYVLRYVNRDGVVLGESNSFSIILEETQSSSMGFSYVFLNNELKLSSDELELEPTSQPEPKPEPRQEPKVELEPEPKLELNLELESEPVSKSEVLQEPIKLQEFTNEPISSSTDFTRQIPENSHCISSKELNSFSLNLSDPDVSMFPLNAEQNEIERETRGRERIQFLIESQHELREGNQELELRYETKQLECEDLIELVQSLEMKVKFCEEFHREGFDVLCRGISLLERILCPDKRIEHTDADLSDSLFSHKEGLGGVQGQVDKIARAANRLVEENKNLGDQDLRKENQRLKEEYQSLSAVVKDYESQLILTNEEQAKNSEKMTQLSDENTFLKSYEQMDAPPKSERTRGNCDHPAHPTYPAKCRPKHVVPRNPPTEKTQSIIITEPSKGNSSSTFTSVNFLKSCSMHPNPVECPICGVVFEEKKTSIERTKHVTNCIHKTEKK